MKNNQIVVSGAVIFKEGRGKKHFLLVKQNEDDKWQFPKITVRRGESSVRASLRMTGEIAGMSTKVLEEAGRGSGSALVNGRSIPQKYYYYLMIYKAGGEIFGFNEYKWADYSKARNMLFLKREKDVMKNAKEVLKQWEQLHKS